MTTYDSAKVDLETAREIVRLSELYLDGTLRLSLNADVRATTLTGMIAALIAGLITLGGAAIFGDGKVPVQPIRLGFGVGAFVASFCLAMALRYTVNATQPREINVPGNYLVSVAKPGLVSVRRVIF